MLRPIAVLALWAPVLQLFHFGAAQDEIVVLGSVVLTRTGDRDPIFQDTLGWKKGIMQLTTLGAQQAHVAGESIRSRYVLDQNGEGSLGNTIYDLNSNSTNPNQLSILAADTQYIAVTAQAFMQGLYPPAAPTNEDYFRDSYVSYHNALLANPLNGSQYGWIQTASSSDPESIWVDGNVGCVLWNLAAEQTVMSKTVTTRQAQTADFYAAVADVLAGDLVPAINFNFDNAPAVYDYASFMYYHDKSTYDYFETGPWKNGTVMTQLRSLSDEYNWLLFDNVDFGERAGAMAGQTLAAKVLGQLHQNIEYRGETAKLSLLFSESPPMISFFSLTGLKNDNPDFYGEPLFGSSMAFELFAYQSVALPKNSEGERGPLHYPGVDDLYVRFLFRNGTNTTSSPDLVAYPIFAANNPLGEKSTSIPYTKFVELMSNFAIGDSDEWCSACQSYGEVPFCQPKVIQTPDSSDGSGPYSITPKVAGALGAVATLSVIIALIVIGVGCCGLRLKRVSPNKMQGRSGKEAGIISGAGGFKGAMKLGSDLDVSDMRGGGVVGKAGDDVAIVAASKEEEYIGKERVGSWELKDGPGKQQHLSFSPPPTSPPRFSRENSRPVSPVSESNYDLGRQRDERDPDEMSAIENPFTVRPVSPARGL